MNSDQPHEPAVQLLYTNLGSLPSTEYGVMNLLPFAEDTEQALSYKRHVCECIIELLDTHGHLQHEAPQAQPAGHAVALRCLACRSPLVETIADENGFANVDAPLFIAGISGLNPDCPHQAITMDDHRRNMEREFAAQMPEPGVSDE